MGKEKPEKPAKKEGGDKETAQPKKGSTKGILDALRRPGPQKK